MNMKTLAFGTAVAVVASATTAYGAFNVELTTNGDFETGDTSGWQYFPSTNSTFNVTNDSNSGAFASELANFAPASAALIKQANIGIGQVNPGDQICISFAAKGSFAAGGVAFAEFFSELAGGGTSASEILGGGPLPLTSDWQTYSFMTTAGPDVSGGVTLQLTATTGGAVGSTAVVFYDDVSVTVVPTPGAFAAFGLGGLALVRRRR